MIKFLIDAAGRLALVVAIGVVAAPVGGPVQAALPGLACKGTVVEGKGSHKTRPVARKIALREWYDKVAASYGAAYASWSRAGAKNLSCSYNPVPGTFPWSCRARARPCRIRNLTPYRQQQPAQHRNRLRRQ